MQLHRRAREFYTLTIVTDATPPIASWSASFDDGVTAPIVGVPHETLPDTWQWLVAGDLADQGSAVAVITRDVRPEVSATDSPEILWRNAPEIRLIT